MFTPTTPVTGLVTTGFTSPTYTIASDNPPNAWSKAFAVTAIGGTQAGVDAQSASRPFVVIGSKPQNIRTLNAVDATGTLRNVPYNVYNVKTSKGLLPLAGQASRNGTVDTRMSVPAGADLADAPNVKAMLGLHVGVLSQQANGLADTLLTGTL
jgi:hypothetical protein